jgi:hypothetical protein
LLGALVLIAAALPAIISAASGPAGAAGPTLDHFECYAATATSSAVVPTPFPLTPPAVLLKNSFAPAGFLAGTGAVQLHCNPVKKQLPSGAVTNITNPTAHLVCWGLHPNPVALPSLVTLNNQFGKGALKPTAVRSLCVPSWKNPQAPSFPAATAPAGLDHFTCYSVVHPVGTPAFSPPASVTLTDQFFTHATSVGVPNLMCAPTSKTVKPAVGGTKVVNPTHYLVCFVIPGSTAFASRGVFAKNQFGIGAVRVVRNTELCVPSTLG